MRSIYTIAGLGLATCVLLSLMMKHTLEVKNDTLPPGMAREIQTLFASKLDTKTRVRLIEQPMQEGGMVWTVRARPAPGYLLPRLAQTIGEHVWRRAPGTVRGLTIRWVQDDGVPLDIIIREPAHRAKIRQAELENARLAAEAERRSSSTPPADPAGADEIAPAPTGG